MTFSRREFLDHEGGGLGTASPLGPGEDYALVIGVNDYPKLRALKGAIADAEAFAAWLRDPEGGRLSAANVRMVLSTPDPLAPIGHEINDALEDLLECAGRTGGRRFYFYFSGHGCVGDRAADIALCMANWSALRRRAALSSEAWLDVVVRSGAFDEVALFLDCCRIWAVRAVGLPPHIDFARPVEREQPTRVFVAYAAEFQRPALEVASRETTEVRGIFTRALLEGLRGEAARAGGIVTAASLKQHIEAEVPELAKRHEVSQRAEVVNGFDSAARFGFAMCPPRLMLAFVDSCESDVDTFVLYGPADEIVLKGNPRHGPWELDVPAGKYVVRTKRRRWETHYGRNAGITRWDVHIGIDLHRTKSLSVTLRNSFDGLPSPVDAWLPAHLGNLHYKTAVAAAWLDPIPMVTAPDVNVPDAPSRMFVVLLDSKKPPWSVRLGVGWSIHGEGVDLLLDRAHTWDDERGSTVFSARMKPGTYTLRWAGQRDIAVRLYPGFTTQLVIDHDRWRPRFESPRMFLVPCDERLPEPPAFGIIDAIDHGLAMVRSDPIELPELWNEVMREEPLGDPMLCLLAAHLLAREETPNLARIEALVDHVESRIGPCPDVQALRLRAILLRGTELPDSPSPHSEPPTLREGLLAFVEASHRRPELIAPGSSLEHACIERFVDSALSSWPTPDRASAVEDWLGAAIADMRIERAARGMSVDALAIAKELGVPTLAVEARLRRDEGPLGSTTEHERPPTSQDPDSVASKRQEEVRRLCLVGEYERALALAEALLAAQPENQIVRHHAEISCEKLKKSTLFIPRIVASREAFKRMSFDTPTVKLIMAIDGELSLKDIIRRAGLEPIDALGILRALVTEGLIEIRRVEVRS